MGRDWKGRRFWRVTAGVLALACLALCGLATARAQTSRNRAGALILEGDRLHAAGQHRAALKLYLRARRLHAHPTLSYHLGITLQAMGRDVLAAEQLQLFLARGRQAPPSSRRLAASLLGQLQRSLGMVSVSCPVAGVRVSIDGRLVGRTPLNIRFFVRPGKHQVVMQKAGYVDLTRDVVLEAGVFRELELLMKGGVSPAPVARPRDPTPTTPPRDPSRPAWEDLVTPDQQDQRRRRKTIYAYAFLGTSAALLTGAGVLYGVGASYGSEAHASYLAASNQAQMDYHYQDVESAQTMLVVGHVLAGAGAVALGLSIYNFATRPRAAERRGRSTLRIAPTPGGIVLGGRF